MQGVRSLFFSEKHIYWYAFEAEVLPNLVFQVALVRFFHVLRQVAVEGEARRIGRQLLHELDLDVFAFVARWWIVLYLWQQLVVQYRGRNLPPAGF